MKSQTINFSNRTWIVRDAEYHKSNPKEWYDASAVKIDSSGNLVLMTHKNPREFHPTNSNPITINTGSGRIYCEEEFSYGKFEAYIKLPGGKQVWPAFWLYGWESWPPEIDILEAYSDKRKSYYKINWKPFLIWNVETNVHYKLENEKFSVGGKGHWFGVKNPAFFFVKYTLEWRPDSIKIFYDDFPVREITDPRILNSMKGCKMKVVLNNSVLNGIKHSPKSKMFIRSFTYEPY